MSLRILFCYPLLLYSAEPGAPRIGKGPWLAGIRISMDLVPASDDDTATVPQPFGGGGGGARFYFFFPKKS
jgi:hypothetical protein